MRKEFCTLEQLNRKIKLDCDTNSYKVRNELIFNIDTSFIFHKEGIDSIFI